MAPPQLDAPTSSMPPGMSAHGELFAETEDLGLVPEATAPLRTSSRTSQPCRPVDGELIAELEGLRLVSEVRAPPLASATTSKPKRTVDSTVAGKRDTSQTASASSHQPGAIVDNRDDTESEDTDTTPSGPPPGPSAPGNGKPPDKQHFLSSEAKDKLKTAGIVAGVAVGLGAAAVLAAPVALAAAGFSSTGVVAGSTAAAYQATLGGYIAQGSAFALCQSWGAAGLTATAQAGVAAGGASVGAVASSVGLWWKRKLGKDPGNNTDGGSGGGSETGTGAETGNVANGKGAGGSGEGGELGNRKDTCGENDRASGSRKVKSTDREPGGKTEGQETCQNEQNEQAAKKQEAFRK
ncbi:uncharacterized protein [Dermacentor andersoni]|nr:circumsporozoite protein-like isoform X2 [Dermacentor andersoni]XP_050046942.1 circumsporozoite protein-like isoform X2 [Dermacentor andersoni]